MDDLISRQAAIDALAEDMPQTYTPDGSHPADDGIFMTQEIYADCIQTLKELPPAQPDIIRCNACKHWTQTTGNMPGFGLGDCDYLNAKLVNCNGYCYWAERREE